MLAQEVKDQYHGDIILALMNGDLRELFREIDTDGSLTFLTLSDDIGMRTYRRTGLFLMEKAFWDLRQNEKETVRVLFTIDQAFYCEIFEDDRQVNLGEEFLLTLEARMRELVEADMPLQKYAVSLQKAEKIFEEGGLPDKKKLFRYRRASNVNIYELDGYKEYFYGYMMPSSGYLKHFSIEKHENGFFLNFPSQKDVLRVDQLDFQPKLFEKMLESAKWAAEVGAATLGDLNDRITQGKMQDLILVSEVDQERRIEKIADQIIQKGGVKFVLIAGPSSSGKTTFSHRISIELLAKGYTPHPIAMDDFFINREDMEVMPDGTLDFEGLNTVDLVEFRRVMQALLNGEEVDMPTFDFKEGKRTYKGNKLKIKEDDILVIEGIHGLNPKVAEGLPQDAVFRIYLSALTSLKIDEHNCFSTRDGRLLRRIVRDARTRGTSAYHTMKQWNKVREGEESHIFPFQENADAVFNSSLVYEISVLKTYVEPQLFAVPKDSPEFYEAKRLLKLLDYCLAFPTEGVAQNSIIREFVGGSCFHV